MNWPSCGLSVLALSSRFDGHPVLVWAGPRTALSVLALSSRFDGRTPLLLNAVLTTYFQYSLCRVVLMVHATFWKRNSEFALSVLALSSRFDGHEGIVPVSRLLNTFSTRSVESF